MRFRVAGAFMLALWCAGLLAAGRAEQTTTTWSGVYTEAQAKVGQPLYVTNCAECHGEDFGGDGFAPALKGPEFMNNWNGLALSELFERIRTSMPPSNPDAVAPKEKAEILAYLLKSQGFPAGTTELANTAPALQSITFSATKPGN